MSVEHTADTLADRYRIERELGRGGMATVYLAHDVRHHRSVALKVLHSELSALLGAERFLKEIELTANLQHPHILPLFDSGRLPDISGGPGGQLYYVMPFVDGESLRARITREGQLPIADVVRIVREVADALSDAHAHGVVHRDIKPDNVLLRGPHAVVTDFGVAKAVTEATGHHVLTSVGVALGTPTYMAPEQAAGEPGVDHRADLYALGVMAYEMLAGKPPFTGSTAQSVLGAHMTQQPAPIADHRPAVPAPLAAVVMRCLEKSPNDRWQTAAELLAELERVAPSGIVTLQPAAASPKQWSQRLLRRPRMWALLAGSLTIIAAVAYALRSRESAAPAVDRTRPPRLAVLPFENLGAQTDEYFADGMTEELTGRLSKLSGLSVVARTSVMQYKKTTKSVTQIAEELGADFLVEGTVRWEKTPDGGGRVRVSPQVIRASDGTHVWTDQFDKPYGTGIFAIQSDIAEHVARSLDVTLRPGDERVVRGVPTSNLAAYDAYIRATLYLDRDLVQNWEAERDAFESLEEAIRLDSGFAAAHSLLATLHLRMEYSGYDGSLGTGITPTQRYEMARAAAMRAIASDSASPQAHRVLAQYYRQIARDTARQRAELTLALRGEPSSPEAITDRAMALFAAGRVDDGIRELERATLLDPRNPRRWMTLASSHRGRRDLASAHVAMDRGIAVAPTEPTLYAELAWQELMAGRREDARATLRNGIAHAGESSVVYRIAQATLWIDMIRILPEELAGPAARATWAQFGADSGDYYVAKINAYWSDPRRSRVYFDSIVTLQRRRGHVGAWGLAGLGRRAEAAREIQRALGGDVQMRGWDRANIAETCVMIGNHDCAVQQIALVLASSSFYTPAIFRLDPVWAPLRNRADFKKLAEIQ